MTPTVPVLRTGMTDKLVLDHLAFDPDTVDPIEVHDAT